MRFIPIALLVALGLAGCGGGGTQGNPSGREKAVDEAQAAFRQAKATGQDLSAGPCLAESLPGLSDWVADIAHDPRQPVDDDPANQCGRYRDSQAHHFVELGPDGQLIRAQ
ncbi:MAG: hypothetical protein ACM31K_06345 [Solirubrobacterales bacterium]